MRFIIFAAVFLCSLVSFAQEDKKNEAKEESRTYFVVIAMTKLDPDPTLVSNQFDTILQAKKRLDEFTKDYSKGGLMYLGNPLIRAWMRERKWTVENTFARPVLGSLSEREEVGDRGPLTISTGIGDRGGVSYGSFQLSSKMGTAQEFVDQNYAEEFKGLKPGSKEFGDKWLEVGKKDEGDFFTMQRDFIADTHYEPLVEHLKKTVQLDVKERSYALQDVVWSTSVQHGGTTKFNGNPNLIVNVIKSLTKGSKPVNDLDDADIITAIYDERGREGKDGTLAYFREGNQSSLRNRFKREKKQALSNLAQEHRWQEKGQWERTGMWRIVR